MKYYKAFNKVQGNNKAGVCRGHLFEEGEIYTLNGELKLCENGFHFCKELVLTSAYYVMDLDKTVYAEVEALSEVEWEQPNCHKGATLKLKILRFLSDQEVKTIVDYEGNYNSGYYNSGNRNSGNYNSGNRNSGNYNSGYYNSGDYNSGDYNSGDCNSGNYNSGHSNSGNSNSGYYNSGNSNSGNYNSGDYNSGDWNCCDKETGYFNSITPETVNIFNKPCNIEVWDNTKKPSFIYNLDGSLEYKDSWKKAYLNSTEEDKELLKQLPNFDKDVFFEITGIMVED